METAQQNISNPQRSNLTTEEMLTRIEVARQITRLFNLERYVYIACCGIAVLLLLTNAVLLIAKGVDIASLGLLFGASGIVSFSIGRLIYMWNRVVDLILSEPGAPGGK